jgi:hypothetical protein
VSQPPLPKNAPVAEADVAELVERPSKAGGVEDPMQLSGISLHTVTVAGLLLCAYSGGNVKPLDIVVFVRRRT